MKYPANKEIVLYGITGEEVFVPEIKVQYDSSSEIQNITIPDEEAASSFFRGLFEKDSIEVQEHFFVLYLNRHNKIKGYYKHSVGGINSTVVDIRIILAAAIKCLSSAIIVAHNHPSGSILPSKEDIAITQKIKEAAKLFDIKLLDSIILTKDSYYSFAHHGNELGIISPGKAKKSIEPEERKTNNVEERKMAKNVNSLTEEIKFIRRFVGLHNKVKSPNSILSFVKTLQKSISQRLITKFSPYVKHINYIQDTLIEFYNKMNGSKKIQIEESTLAKLMAISGREKVYPSVKFIKQFIGMQGKEISEEKKKEFLKQLNNAANNKKIFPNDPFAEKLQKIYSYLKSGYRPGNRVAFAKAELSGLSCICKNYDKSLGALYDKKIKGKKTRICNSYRYSDAGRGACSYNGGLAGIPAVQASPAPAIDPSRRSMNSMDFVKLKFQGIGFSGKWKNFIGDPTSGFTAMVFGMPKFGKSFLCLDFAGYLARNHGKVIYVAKEEDLDRTLQIKVLDKEVAHPNLDLYNYLPDDLSGYKFVFFDSVTRLGLAPEDLAKYEKKYPEISFIYVFQVRKDGVFRGRNDFQHDVDIVIEVPEKGKAIQSGRYNQGGEMDIFPSENSN